MADDAAGERVGRITDPARRTAHGGSGDTDVVKEIDATYAGLVLPHAGVVEDRAPDSGGGDETRRV
jgi:hypothetical protein